MIEYIQPMNTKTLKQLLFSDVLGSVQNFDTKYTKHPVICLGEVASIINGHKFTTEDISENGNPVIRPKNLKGNHIDIFDTKRIRPDICGKWESFKIRNDDVVFPLYTNIFTPLAVTNLTDQPIYIGTGVGKISLIHNSDIDRAYLSIFISSYYFFELLIEKMGADTKIDTRLLKHIHFPIPTIEKQQEILKLIDCADTAKPYAKRNPHKGASN